MRQPLKARRDIDAGSNHFLRRVCPQLGVPLGEIDYLRGHKDDFFGDQIRDEYDVTDINGVGSVVPTLQDAAHGGWARMTSGAGAGRYSRLWLGDAADGYDTLDADEGWVMVVRWKADNLTNTAFNFGATNAAFNRFILGVYNSALGATWFAGAHDGVFSATAAASGPAVDTWYWMALEVQPSQLRLFVDGGLLITHTTNIPPDVITPIVYSESNGGAIALDVDFWAVIPRNL